MINESCTSAGMRVNSSTRAICRLASRASTGWTPALASTGRRPTSGRNSSRSESTLRWCPPCPAPTSPARSPPIAAARCSDTHDFAVPGTPSNNNARSVASVAIAISIRARIADILGRNDKLVLERAAHQIRRHRPRRQPPLRRTRARIGLRQLLQFLGKLLLGVFAQYVRHPVISFNISCRNCSRAKNLSTTDARLDSAVIAFIKRSSPWPVPAQSTTPRHPENPTTPTAVCCCSGTHAAPLIQHGPA